MVTCLLKLLSCCLLAFVCLLAPAVATVPVSRPHLATNALPEVSNPVGVVAGNAQVGSARDQIRTTSRRANKHTQIYIASDGSLEVTQGPSLAAPQRVVRLYTAAQDRHDGDVAASQRIARSPAIVRESIVGGLVTSGLAQQRAKVRHEVGAQSVELSMERKHKKKHGQKEGGDDQKVGWCLPHEHCDDGDCCAEGSSCSTCRYGYRVDNVDCAGKGNRKCNLAQAPGHVPVPVPVPVTVPVDQPPAVELPPPVVQPPPQPAEQSPAVPLQKPPSQPQEQSTPAPTPARTKKDDQKAGWCSPHEQCDDGDCCAKGSSCNTCRYGYRKDKVHCAGKGNRKCNSAPQPSPQPAEQSPTPNRSSRPRPRPRRRPRPPRRLNTPRPTRSNQIGK